MSKHRLGDYPSQPYRDMLAEDYKTARDLGTALYHEIAARIDYKRHSYARLILPFAGHDARVNQLIICSVQQTFDDLLQYLD
jgi:hypothetical protein